MSIATMPTSTTLNTTKEFDSWWVTTNLTDTYLKRLAWDAWKEGREKLHETMMQTQLQAQPPQHR